MRKTFILKYLVLVFLVLLGAMTKTKQIDRTPKGLDTLKGNMVSHLFHVASKTSNLK